ncbi:hypothetical protein WOLCODRAFT_135180 [Wolfiporia cocos MD-104 SS10]|uniref:INO80 complex subunit B-like conserved region domain-containing protein n=1 Tax=Wolfiporia cocos (strain MD-104) TaxID=742152 RepID=A0A2H3J172_WOLCO|nr:hypothetical protein WOLCODRAFT_135180 [Wolfiporia cocos MD-104 SS10]
MSDERDSDDAASDMQLSQSEVDQINDDMDVEEEEVQEEPEEQDAAMDEEDEEKDVEVEEEDLPDETSELDALSPSQTPDDQDMGPAPTPRLRIKLKLPAHSGSTQTAETTPNDAGPSSSSRRDTSRGSDIESEDEDEDADEDADGDSSQSESVANTGRSGRALTARQAVLANVVDPSHVALSAQPSGRKKKQLTEIEMALKREETARKRKNLSEKKLEDEKQETINRLLKKQSRGRGRRNALSTAEDRVQVVNAAELDEDGDAGPEAAPPTMYRWISTTRGANGAEDGGEKMRLLFSVPVNALPPAEAADNASTTMDVDPEPDRSRDKPSPQCDVQGCMERRKYRLVRDFAKGACGMSHLKMLEAQVA